MQPATFLFLSVDFGFRHIRTKAMAATNQRNRKKNAVYPEINTPTPDNSTPAYPGARFNSLGFCTNHNSIRLCTVTDEDKYKILRKVCFKCGSSNLRTNSRVATLHGNAKKVISRCETPKSMVRATTPPVGRDRRNDHFSASRRVSGEQRRKTSKSCERSTINKKKNVAGPKKNQSSCSKETTKPTPTQLGHKLERNIRPSRSRSRSRHLSTTTSRTMKNSMSQSELVGLYPPPPGRPSGRSRSKSGKRQTKNGTSKTSSNKDDTKNDSNKFVRSTLSPPPLLSSSKSVEAKVKEITVSKKAHGKIDYAELGKLITMKDDETTLPTLLCPATPDSFRSKEAVFSIDKSDLIVELYNKKRLDDAIRSSDRRENRSITKLKSRI